jgi:hypothetical protein
MIRIALVFISMIVGIVCWLNRGQANDAHNLLKDPSELRYWQWDQGSSSGGVTMDHGAIRCDILVDNGSMDALRLYQATVALKSGHVYHLSFETKGDPGGRSIQVAGMSSMGTNVRKHGIGLQTTFYIDKDWRSYERTFTAGKIDAVPSAVPVFELGNGGKGSVWLRNIRLDDEGATP